jgi:hypothetical protein
VTVLYRGTTPDQFKVGRELMKCPSKYEPAKKST